MVTIVCVSDTHGFHDKTEVPDGDVLLHAGDLTRHGELDDVVAFNDWLGRLPHRHKIVIAGNHDFCFQHQADRARARLTNAIYLEDTGTTIEGLAVYGSPWQPWFLDWAFNLKRGPELAEKWAQIPEGTDILITHGPPAGIGDRTLRGESVGCVDLLDRIRVLRPRLHVYGHIHEAAGVVAEGGTLFVNASTNLGRGRGVVLKWDGSTILASSVQ